MDATIDWLLEAENPSARALALRHLADRLPGDPDVDAAQAAIPAWGPARDILAAQWPPGYWVAPGVGYSPKHRATVWQVIFLAALGAPRTRAIDAACAYVLDHSRLSDGRFTAGKTTGQATAGLNGSLLRAFGQLGYEDSRLYETAQALAGMVLQPRSPLGGPQAGTEGEVACLADAARALAGLLTVPVPLRSASMDEAIDVAVEILLGKGSQALLRGEGAQVANDEWQRFGFPPSDTVDLLEAVEALVDAGHGTDPRLGHALDLVRSKQDRNGRWALDRVPDKTWASFGQVGRPNKWVTIRALRVLKADQAPRAPLPCE